MSGRSGSPDAELYQALLNGEYADGRAWEGLAPEAAGLLKGKSADDAREWIASPFRRRGPAGRRPDREILARGVLDPAAAFFVADAGEVFMHVDASRIPDDVIEAARRVAAGADSDGPLREIAKTKQAA